jgi:hypothetical protein
MLMATVPVELGASNVVMVPPEDRRKPWYRESITAYPESVGINRHVVGDERALHRRLSQRTVSGEPSRQP